MKKLTWFVLLLATVSEIPAQPSRQVAPKPVTILKNMNDSVSYVLGESAAFNLKQQGLDLPKLNATLFMRAVNDILQGKKPLVDDATANTLMNNYMSMMQAQKVKPTIDAGLKFLAKNKLRTGVRSTSSGMQYEIIKDTTGEKPSVTDSVTCHYRGTLVNGTEIDNSYVRGQPMTFAMKGVIRGWTEALQLMSVGSRYKLYIPYTLGYGAFDYGSIPGGSVLIFEVELLNIRKMPAVEVRTSNQ